MSQQENLIQSNTPAEFLAVLFNMKHIYRPGLCYIVIGNDVEFTKVSTMNSLPNDFNDCTLRNITSWTDAIKAQISKGSNSFIVLTTEEKLGDKPAESWQGELADLITVMLEDEMSKIIDIFLVGSDGWALFFESDDPKLYPLDEVYETDLYQSELVKNEAGEWGVNGPDEVSHG